MNRAPSSLLAAPPREECLSVVIDGKPQAVRFRRSQRATRYTLRIDARSGDVLVTMPKRGSLAFARGFVERHEGWIRARIARRPLPVPFADGAIVPLRGAPHRIVHRPAARGVAFVERAGEADLLVVAGDPAHLPRRVRDFLMREARRDLEPAVARHAAALGVSIERVTIRDTVSRWGSCSSKGALSFSWRIVMAPPVVLDYLAAHEVAHRREMNHSPRYWAVVERLFPRFSEAEAWLKRNGGSLHRYGAEA
jgi:predicted metal-dependent hydrolase